MLAPYRSYGSLLLPVGVGLGLYVDNLQVSSLLAIACRLATYSSFGALLWPVGVGMGLYVGNLQFFWGIVLACGVGLGLYVGTVQVSWFLAIACWSGFGAVCWHPTGLMVPCYCLLE